MIDDRTARALGLLNAAGGAFVVLRPSAVARAVSERRGRPDTRIVRVLGARQCVQGLITVVAPGEGMLWLGSTVDTAHAVSMLPLLLTRFRRAALVSVAVATASAVTARIIRDA